LLFESKLVMLGDKGSHALLFSSTGWRRLTDKVTRAVGRYHQQFPLRSGMPKEELKSKLAIPPGSFPAAVQQLVRDSALAEAGKLVYLPSHRIELKKGQQAAVDAFLRPLTQNPYSPPSETTMDQELLELLIEQRKVVKVAENVIFAASAYDEMVERVIAHVKSHGKITVAEVRDLFQTSRKYALALMEHLDEQKITRRVGDERVLR
jgi:selenocysteine-specific elongation factor